MSTEFEFTPTPNVEGGFLCYVNGLEVPIVGARVSFGVGEIPTASIQFFPSQLLQRFGAEDRVPVVLFYLDTQYEPDNPSYRLLFDGEITDWSYQSQAGSRSISANAVADISIMQQMIYGFMNTIGKMGEMAANPDPNVLTQPGAFYTYSLFQDGLLYKGWGQGASIAAPPSPTIQRPFELLYNVVKSVLDYRVPLHNQAIPIVNFFRRWARRQNFHNKFIACPNFDDVLPNGGEVFPLLRAARSKALLETMQNDMAAAAPNSTVYDLLTQLFNVVYCEIAMLPTAPCHRVNLKTAVIEGASNITINPAGAAGAGATEEEEGDFQPLHPFRIANYFVKPQTLFAIPPSCNVVFPSMIKSLTYAESFRAQPTRVYLNEDFVDMTLPGAQLASSVLTLAYPPQAAAAMQEKLSIRLMDNTNINQKTKDAVATGMNILVWPEEFFKGPVPSRGQIPAVFGFLIRQIQQAAPPPPGQAGDTIDKQDGVRRLLDIYAEYEYYRQRYAQRGGAVDMVWNPYVVPGYPCVIFDKEGGLNQVGYVNSVVHTISGRGMATSINYAFGRTVNEWVGLIRDDSIRTGRVFGSGPIEPIDTVRQALQDQAKAEIHYDTLFHGKRYIRNKKAAINRAAAVFIQDLLENHDGSAVTVSGPTESTSPLMARPPAGTTPAPVMGVPVISAKLDKPLKLAHAFERPAKDTASALTYIARPICTLREYVLFLHAGRVPAAIKKTWRQISVKGAASPAGAYGRIQQYVTGPGAAPSAAVAGATTGAPPPGGTQPTASTSGVLGQALNSRTTAQTRTDWDSILIAYREEVRTKVEPLE